MTGSPSPAPATPPSTRDSTPLRELAEVLSAPSEEAAAPDISIRGIASHTGAVRPGFLFVAVPGTRVDGHDFVPEALARGAAAVVAERPVATGSIPCLLVPSSRRALAALAAAWYGSPGNRLRLVGITGTVGKTSVLSLLEAILSAAGAPAGAIGSLGVHAGTEVLDDTGYTAPDPLLLHRELARLLEEGCGLVAMEVTSHALVQERVHGLRFDLGIFTNLLPLEHGDYHGSFREYVEAKRLFFDHLRGCVPLVYNSDDRGVRRLVHGHDVQPVGCGTGRSAVVRLENVRVTPLGTTLTLAVRRSLPRVGGGMVEPLRLPLELRLLGRTNVANLGLAATAGLCLGAPAEVVRKVAAAAVPPRRRMEILHRGRFTVLDDTVGHPESVSAAFEVVQALAPRRVHAAYAVRGSRGERINRESAEALAVWAERLPLGTLVLTRSEEAADERNVVQPGEWEAFRDALAESGVHFQEEGRLDRSVRRALAAAEEGDMVLLLGAQGMDRGRDTVAEWLDRG